MFKYCKTIRSEHPYCATVGMFTSTVFGYCILLRSSLFQYFLLQHYTGCSFLQYLDIAYYSDPACFSTFYCSTIDCPYSNLKFLILVCEVFL